MLTLSIKVPSAHITADKQATITALRQAATEVAKAARGLLRSSRASGRRRGGHTASAPGQPPARLSGRLASSIRVRVRADARNNTIVARIVDTARDPKGRPYSRFLETGAFGGGVTTTRNKRTHRRRTAAERQRTANSSRVMAPRPYLTLALSQAVSQDALGQRVLQAVLDGVTLQVQP